MGWAGCPPHAPVPPACPQVSPVPMGDPTLRSQLRPGWCRCRAEQLVMPTLQGQAWTECRQDLHGAWRRRPWHSQPRASSSIRATAKQNGQDIRKTNSKALSPELGCSRGGGITAPAINKTSISSCLEGSLLARYLLPWPWARGATPGRAGCQGAEPGGVPVQAGVSPPPAASPVSPFSSVSL